MFRRTMAVALAALTVLAGLPGAARAGLPPPRLAWGECADDLPDVPPDPRVRCARLRLPVD